MRLIDEHRRNPTTETSRELRNILWPEASRVLRRNPARKLPAWLSPKHFTAEVEAALDLAIAKLAHVDVPDNQIADFVADVIDERVQPLLTPVDLLAGMRAPALRRGWKTRTGATEVEEEFQGPDPRDRVAEVLAEMLDVAEGKTHDALADLLAGEKLGTIRQRHKRRGPDLLRMLIRLRERT